MKILAVDLGDKTIGLALSDSLLITAQALGNYRRVNSEEDINYFRRLIKEHDIGEIVVGLPLRMNGSEGRRAERAKKFASRLKEALKIPVVLWDERLSTQEAYKILHAHSLNGREKKKLKDIVSATIILSAYLEKKRLETNGD
ncbi:MAG: Holliday junction resolvase RuvX [Candidatus Aminicenantales bacterium]